MMIDWENFFDLDDFVGTRWMKEEMLKHCNAKIREALEAAPKVYGHSQFDYGWTAAKAKPDDLSARLIDVKPIEKGEP